MKIGQFGYEEFKKHPRFFYVVKINELYRLTTNES